MAFDDVVDPQSVSSSVAGSGQEAGELPASQLLPAVEPAIRLAQTGSTGDAQLDRDLVTIGGIQGLLKTAEGRLGIPSLERQQEEQLLKASENRGLTGSELLASAILQIAPILIGSAIGGRTGGVIGGQAGTAGVGRILQLSAQDAELERKEAGARANLLGSQIEDRRDMAFKLVDEIGQNRRAQMRGREMREGFEGVERTIGSFFGGLQGSLEQQGFAEQDPEAFQIYRRAQNDAAFKDRLNTALKNTVGPRADIDSASMRQLKIASESIGEMASIAEDIEKIEGTDPKDRIVGNYRFVGKDIAPEEKKIAQRTFGALERAIENLRDARRLALSATMSGRIVGKTAGQIDDKIKAARSVMASVVPEGSRLEAPVSQAMKIIPNASGVLANVKAAAPFTETMDEALSSAINTLEGELQMEIETRNFEPVEQFVWQSVVDESGEEVDALFEYQNDGTYQAVRENDRFVTAPLGTMTGSR